MSMQPMHTELETDMHVNNTHSMYLGYIFADTGWLPFLASFRPQLSWTDSAVAVYPCLCYVFSFLLLYNDPSFPT